MMKLSSFLILLATVLVNLFFWTVVNKPHNLVESTYPIHSLSYNPYTRDQSPFSAPHISQEQLERDFALLSKKTKGVRLYSTRGGFEAIPEIAKKYDMTVMASAHLEKNPLDNLAEVEAAIKLAGLNRNVSRLIIGNETQLKKLVPREELVSYLKMARKKLKTPVSTAEPWDFWINNQDFAKEVDFIAIHVLPFWAEVPIHEAVGYVLGKYELIKSTFPYKMVVIAETGWPSDGPQRGAAEATLANEAAFVRNFITQAKPLKLSYNIIEAFDQPWKSVLEGRAGEHWGIMNADRQDKFPITGPVLEDPNWKYWAISSTLLGFLSITFFFFRKRDLGFPGRIFSVVIFQLAAVFATELAREASDQYMSPGDIVFWTIMVTAQVLLAIILLTDAVEIADVVGYKPLKRRFMPKEGEPAHYPFVSIHLACCREPPSMVIATLDSLAKLDWKNFEVIVVDNNTLDPALWRPVQKRCEALGERFRFYSLGKWPGFKAGALNFALKVTNPRAQVVGVVDADYVVEPNWLKATIPYFDDPNIGVVQAPQEHRGFDQSLFQQMENDEYSGFFRIGMVQRNEHNAIIQHGTMTLIDKTTLFALGGWAEWCICEDAELGLRILNTGKQAVYLDHPFGRGLVPDSYEAYAKQRFRWAYGGMRIFRRYWREIFGFTGNLNLGQRYQFVKGWLPWIGDSFHMIFTWIAILWSIELIIDPLHTDFPEPIFIYPALALVVLRIAGTLWTYMARVKIGKRRTVLAMIAGGSLTHKIAKAVFQGLLNFEKPFYRTPKMVAGVPVLEALTSVYEELFFALVLTGLSYAILQVFGTVNDQAKLWSVALLIQIFPYFAAIVASLVSAGSGVMRKGT